MTTANTSKPIKIAILEDDQIMREYLAELIEATENMKLDFTAENLATGLKFLNFHQPDLCLVDIDLPDGSGIEFINALQQHKNTQSLVLTVLGDKNSVMTALKAGANGYLLKDTPPEQITRDILAVTQGKNPISPQAATHLLNTLQVAQHASKSTDLPNRENTRLLSAREKDILVCFSKGLSYKETASSLDISHHTVNDYVKSIYQKLEVHSRNEAIYEATQQGLLHD